MQCKIIHMGFFSLLFFSLSISVTSWLQKWDNSHLNPRRNTGALMPVRLKVQCLTRMEKRCTGSSGNGTKASTAEALLRPLVSGERVSIPVNQSQTSGGVARGTAGGLASGSAIQGLQPLPAWNSVRATSPSFIHQSCLTLILMLTNNTSVGLLGPGFLILEQSHC